MEHSEKTYPGLKYRHRKDGSVRAVWIARADAVAEGFPIKTVNLTHLLENPEALKNRCERLQAEMKAWSAKRKGFAPEFNGTFASLFELYETDPESTYRNLKPSSLRPYKVYLRKLKNTIGARRIDAVDGRDFRRWFEVWSKPDTPGGKPKIAAAGMAISIIKAAVSFGVTCRKPGCVELRQILDEMEFSKPKRRQFAPTAEQVTAARKAAHDDRRPLRALAYAIQFETTLRQYDVIGEWVPLSDPRPSAVLGYNEKWIGPHWSNISDDLILAVTPTKTENTTEAGVEIDLKVCPMVMEELQHVTNRSGPIIINEHTGKPYRHNVWRDAWRADAKASGIEDRIWNRDLRAGGITEGGKAGASIEDRAKQAGHANPQTTARVYDRDKLEAQRRVSRLRAQHRGEKK